MVLLYLTHDEHNDKFVDGATTFPLALPLKNEEQAGIFCPHASRLVDKKIYHIMKDIMTEDTVAIERSAVSLFHKYLTHPGESTKQSGHVPRRHGAKATTQDQYRDTDYARKGENVYLLQLVRRWSRLPKILPGRGRNF